MGFQVSPVSPIQILPRHTLNRVNEPVLRQISSDVTNEISYTKPYWSTWRSSAQGIGADKGTANGQQQCPIDLEAPLYTVPEEIARRKNMSHQVQPGKATAYAHKISSPKYMDTCERPYAVFVFKYRSTGTCILPRQKKIRRNKADKFVALLEQMFKVIMVASEKDEKARLKGLSKDEIIEHFMAAKVSCFRNFALLS